MGVLDVAFSPLPRAAQHLAQCGLAITGDDVRHAKHGADGDGQRGPRVDAGADHGADQERPDDGVREVQGVCHLARVFEDILAGFGFGREALGRACDDEH